MKPNQIPSCNGYNTTKKIRYQKAHCNMTKKKKKCHQWDSKERAHTLNTNGWFLKEKKT